MKLPPLPPRRGLASMKAFVDVWLVSCTGACAPQSQALLSPEERLRADSFVFEEHRIRFIHAHGALREILSRYTLVPPECLRFEYGEHGKPFLKDAGSSLCFNLSHSSELAVVAVSGMSEIGVDLESVRPIAEWMEISRNTFHPAANEWILSQPAHKRMEAFFQVWTATEAFVKASGLGIAQRLDSFSVVGEALPQDCVITRLDVPSGYVGAVAHPPPSQEIHVRWWRQSAESPRPSQHDRLIVD